MSMLWLTKTRYLAGDRAAADRDDLSQGHPRQADQPVAQARAPEPHHEWTTFL